MRAVFSWSCRHLDAAAARAFRLSGLHPGPDLDATPPPRSLARTVARPRCWLLARGHLIHPTGPGRYAMHDLLRAYARELAGCLAASRSGIGR